MLPLIKKLNEALETRESIAKCTVVATGGSTPLKAGAAMIVWENGKSFGTIGGGSIEKLVIEDAMLRIQMGEVELKKYNLLDSQMCCGGTMQIFIEPMKRTKQLLIFGTGHIGYNVASFAQNLDFKTVVIDERPELMDKINFSSTEKKLINHREAFPLLTFDTDTFIVICTHLHEYDREILAYCINKPNAYLGMIGSKRKVLVTRKRFLQQNICSEEQLDKVDMPMGFDIGQNSPAEIALGIIAKVIAVANGKEITTGYKITEYEKASFDSNGCS